MEGTVKEVIQIAATVIIGLGGAGAIIGGLSKYFGQMWADRALAKQRQEFEQLNIQLKNELDITKVRVQAEIDRISVRHKLVTENEFEKIRELWRHVETLRGKYIVLPTTGWRDRHTSVDDPSYKFNERESEEFIDAVSQADRFWRMESLLIPKEIADLMGAAFQILWHEKMIAQMYPDPFLNPTKEDDNPTGFLPFEISAETGFFKERNERRDKFMKAAEGLQTKMREHIRTEEKQFAKDLGNEGR